MPLSLRSVLRIYNLVMPIGFLFSFPGYFAKMVRRGNYGKNFGQRFGFYSDETRRALAADNPIWIHAVSVGEVLIAHKLIQALRVLAPAQPIVLSCTTSTGYQLALQRQTLGYLAIYNPLDLNGCVARAFEFLRPRLLVLVEAEIWPNLLWHAKQEGIPIVLVNARLSPRSERRFTKFQALTRPLFQELTQVCVQAEEDIDRWARLGVARERIAHTGSIKYDQQDSPEPEAQIETFRQLLQTFRGGRAGPVILAGSTHAGEERYMADAFQEVRQTVPGAFLILVPRHWERGKEVVRDLAGSGLRPILKTEWQPDSPAPEDACLIVNTTGELRAWYHLADVVLIGKSFLAEGGQNPVEPILAGKAVVMGPNMQNFEILTARLVAARGAVQLADPSGLAAALRGLLADSAKRKELVANGKGVVVPDQGASRRSAREILALFDGETEHKP